MTKEVMKLALEALETAWYHVGTFAPTDDAIELYDQARKSLRQALAKQEQDEPKEWVGLSDEDDIDWEEGDSLRDLFKAIESKLKEKTHEQT